MIIRKLTVKGFKSLILDEPIELGRVNCFIGANGALLSPKVPRTKYLIKFTE